MQMYRRRPLLASVAPVAILLVMSTSAAAQAVDCLNPTTAIQTAICADPDLKTLDVRMSGLYADLINVSSPELQGEFATNQSQWATTWRDACAREVNVRACLSSAFNGRNAFLAAYARWQLGPASPRSMMYFCEDKTILPVEYVPKGGANDRVRPGKAKVTYADTTVSLPYVQSLNGGMYSNSKMTLLNRGAAVTLDHDGKRLTCVETPPLQ